MMLASWYTDFLIWKAERRLQKLKRRSTREEQSDEIDDADFALRVLKEKHDVFDLANSIFWVLALALGAFLVLLTLHSTGRM